MMERKPGLGSRLFNMFVETPDPGPVAPAAPAPPPAPEEASHAGPAAVQVEATQETPADLSFPDVLRRHRVTDKEQDVVTRALQVIQGLPVDAPVELKRHIVTAALSAFGIPVLEIIEAALVHEAALERFLQVSTEEAAAAQQRIETILIDLRRQIESAQERQAKVVGQQRGVAAACTVQRSRALEVVAFFGQEQADRVRKESVRLADMRTPKSGVEGPRGQVGTPGSDPA